MKSRSFIPLGGLVVVVALVAVPNQAVSTQQILPGDAWLEDTGSLQYREDGYGNPDCDGRCGGRPCCDAQIY